MSMSQGRGATIPRGSAIQGASISKESRGGKTPLIAATREDASEVVCPETPLPFSHATTSAAQPQVCCAIALFALQVKLLLSRGADPAQTTVDGMSAVEVRLPSPPLGVLSANTAFLHPCLCTSPFPSSPMKWGILAPAPPSNAASLSLSGPTAPPIPIPLHVHFPGAFVPPVCVASWLWVCGFLALLVVLPKHFTAGHMQWETEILSPFVGARRCITGP